MKIKILILSLLFSVFSFSNERYYFSDLTLEDGLSQITVVCIHQDTKGFMWFGTRNGLNRFDGYNFDIYLTDTEDNSSISDNHILCITEDNNGNLWVGTNNGLNYFDITTNKFKRYFHDKNNPNSLSHNTILSVYCDDENNLWVGTNNGLNLYDLKTDTFKNVSIGGNYINDRVNAIAKRGKEIFIGTLYKGLIAYDYKSGMHKTYINDPQNPNSLPNDYARSILVDRNDNLWVGTRNGGVAMMKKGTDKFTIYNNTNGLSNDYVRSICEAPDGNILIGTFNGLNVFDPRTGKIEQYKKYGAGQGNLSHYSVISVYFDRAQTLWVGTYAGGVCYYNRYGQKFRFYNPGAEYGNILGIIGPITEIDNRLYVATEGGGLLEMDKDTGAMRNYKMFEGQDNTHGQNIIKSLCHDGKRVLCGTNVGTIYSFDLISKRFSLIYDINDERSIYYLSRSKNGDLIIGGVSDAGFSLLSSDGSVRKKFPVKGKDDVIFSDVRCIYELEKNVFLIGTRNDGLYCYDYNNYSLKNYKYDPTNSKGNIPENYVTGIFKDNAGNVWIGTFGGGISLLDTKTDKFTTYGLKDNLQNSHICSIVEDNNRHLWISTISGITDFDPETKTFINYTHANGIKVDEFTPHAGLKLMDGNIAFSGSNGFVTFNPQKMSSNPYIPPVILRSLSVNNNLIRPDGEDGILKEQLDKQKEIVLKYDQSNIAIEYSALNFVLADKNQYSYMLEGFDSEWNEVGSRRIAYYTNIPPGKYRFIVKGSNNDDVWNNDGTSIEIAVLPPFWKTWWAYCIYILLLSGILFFIYRYFNEKKRLQDDIKLKQLEAKAQEEFHEARNKLFTNFSHELRTPLTLIISPLEDIVEKEDLSSKVKNNLLLMRSNSRRLLRLVNNLMDFQKKESGTMQLKVSQGDFVQFTKDIMLFFDDLAASRNIGFQLHHSVESIQSWYDKSMMEKVYFNFLSNAFKNVPDGGSIDVSIDPASLEELSQLFPAKAESFNDSSIQYLILEIKDSGVGIDVGELEKIFIPFYQVAQNEHSSSGTGLGLSLSKSIIEMHHGIIWAESPEGTGAIFRCILPVTKKYFTDEEIVEDDISYDSIFAQGIDVPEEKKMEISKRKNPYTVLVVEDNIDVRRYIISHLSDKYTIIEASNGREGIDKAINNLPDLIISDLMMPKMNGMEMCAQIKNDIRTSHIPVILLTARTMSSDIKEGYETGADDYITKPFDSSVLVARVDNIIQARAKLKELYGKRFSLESLGVEAVSVEEKFLQKLYAIMEKNISNPELDLDGFSQEIGMSRTNLYRKIKALTNLSPNEFIRNFRLTMGAKMLREAKLTVSEVYVAVGFNSHAYFSNCFKAFYGVSPTEYANQPLPGSENG